MTAMVHIFVPMEELTKRQKEVLEFVKERIMQTSMPPTLTEISNEFGFASTRGAVKHLEALETKGYVKLLSGQSRGISLRSRNRDVVRSKSLSLPILGRVAAGNPLGTDNGSGEQMLVDCTMFSPIPDYLLRVKGHSMKDDGIWDGDLVAVHRTPTATNNQIVIARIDGEITIKRLKQTKNKIYLLPRNPEFSPIEVPSDADFAIEGIYCGLVRTA